MLLVMEKMVWKCSSTVGCGIAMGNANDEVKKYAHKITDEVQERWRCNRNRKIYFKIIKTKVLIFLTSKEI